MKKQILIIFTILLLAPNILAIYDQSCKLAYPMMEVLECEARDSFTVYDQSIYRCISECTANIDLFESGGLFVSFSYTIYINGNIVKSESVDDNFLWSNERKSLSIPFKGGDEFKLITNAGRKSIQITDKNKYLFATNHEWPQHKLEETQNCIPQKRVYDLIKEQVGSGSLPSVYSQGGVDALGNNLQAPERFIDLSQFNLMKEMIDGETISYFYRWTEVPDVNLKHDSSGNSVYCGGSTQNRKLISYNTISTRGGECYNVPAQKIRDVDCCLDGDCSFTGELCGPDFTCTDRKPCNSDYDCGTEDALCNNKELTTWKCEYSRNNIIFPNGEEYKGWCKEEKKQVPCCQNSCPLNYHCDYNSGCVKDIHFMACPPGSCCLSGDDYVPQQCSAGLQCCTAGGSVGACKETCIIPDLFNGNLDLGGDYCDTTNEFGAILNIAGGLFPEISPIIESISGYSSSTCDEPIEENSDEGNDFGFIGDLIQLVIPLFTLL